MAYNKNLSFWDSAQGPVHLPWSITPNWFWKQTHQVYNTISSPRLPPWKPAPINWQTTDQKNHISKCLTLGYTVLVPVLIIPLWMLSFFNYSLRQQLKTVQCQKQAKPGFIPTVEGKHWACPRVVLKGLRRQGPGPPLCPAPAPLEKTWSLLYPPAYSSGAAVRIIKQRQTKGIQESALKILKYSTLNCGRIVGIVFCRLLMVFVNHGLIEKNSNRPQLQKTAFKPCFLLHLQLLKVKVTNASKLVFQEDNLKGIIKWKSFYFKFRSTGSLHGF